MTYMLKMAHRQKLVNIPRSVNDPSHRYRMETIILSNNARGTTITNLDSISKSLNRSTMAS